MGENKRSRVKVCCGAIPPGLIMFAHTYDIVADFAIG